MRPPPDALQHLLGKGIEVPDAQLASQIRELASVDTTGIVETALLAISALSSACAAHLDECGIAVAAAGRKQGKRDEFGRLLAWLRDDDGRAYLLRVDPFVVQVRRARDPALLQIVRVRKALIPDQMKSCALTRDVASNGSELDQDASKDLVFDAEVPYTRAAAVALQQLAEPCRDYAEVLIKAILVSVSLAGTRHMGSEPLSCFLASLVSYIESVLSRDPASETIVVSSSGVEISFVLRPHSDSAMPFVITGVRVSL